MGKESKHGKDKAVKASKETPSKTPSKSSSSEDKDSEEVDSYDEKIKFVNVISTPLANKKLTKKIYKLVKKACQAKFVKRGVKEVVKALRKGEKGFCVLAGDISPMDVICHLPIMCEDRKVPYIYIPSKHDLGASAGTKRPTSCVLINPKASFGEMELYEKVVAEVSE